MAKLKLFELHHDLYGGPSAATAYIYYSNGTDAMSRDQHGQPIGSFYQEPFTLKKHLESHVVPVVNAIIASKGYKVVAVDFVNNAPHPVLCIQHESKQAIDLAALRALINSGLNPQQIQSKQSRHTTMPFFKPHDSKKEDPDDFRPTPRQAHR